ncbi:MAG TPA: hypothetical protein PKE12_06715 [Kiritimatiellia bacterium]|nr:hypothetical protein [Kiritimatiellia bacterium]
MAFTEQGVAMLSSVLRSEQAVQINIAIMRAFVQLRGALAAHRELAEKLSELESRVSRHDEGIEQLFEAIRLLMAPEPEAQRPRYGFELRERRVRYGSRPRAR